MKHSGKRGCFGFRTMWISRTEGRVLRNYAPFHLTLFLAFVFISVTVTYQSSLPSLPSFNASSSSTSPQQSRRQPLTVLHFFRLISDITSSLSWFVEEQLALDDDGDKIIHDPRYADLSIPGMYIIEFPSPNIWRKGKI